MTVRIGFHGFGRIGRNIFRVLHDRPGFEVRCIADVAQPDRLVYLLNYDSIHGRFPEEVDVGSGHMFVGGKAIPMLYSKEPGDVRWRDYDVDVVVEASGVYRSKGILEKHLEAGARRVVLTVPPEGELDPVYSVGLNDDKITREQKVISNASCTSNALGLVLKVLDGAFGIERASMTTVHAYTNDLRLADVPHRQLRRSRAAAENIIPSTSYSTRVVEHLLPSMKGRLSGMALNVPVPDGSVIDLVTRLKRPVTREEVNGAMRSAARSHMQGVLEYCEQPVVSSDVVGNTHSAVFDSLLTKVLGGDLVKTVTWYDNGWGYANRVVDLMERLAATL
ncbi:MAG: aldehyde dehydrogenase [Planctomycetes bacterium]|nr:aldehyde dehydrogenase [Planctomycetota bacterium]